MCLNVLRADCIYASIPWQVSKALLYICMCLRVSSHHDEHVIACVGLHRELSVFFTHACFASRVAIFLRVLAFALSVCMCQVLSMYLCMWACIKSSTHICMRLPKQRIISYYQIAPLLATIESWLGICLCWLVLRLSTWFSCMCMYHEEAERTSRCVCIHGSLPSICTQLH